MKDTELFYEYAKDIIANEYFLKTKEIFSHGTISIYTHSIKVAQLAFTMIEDKTNIDKRCVVRAALLHDFFLYEWHIPGLRYLMHGWAHPRIAAEKAKEIFNISEKEASCIRTHMWPWTLFKIPRSREAWAISIADKIIALKESFLCRGRRAKLSDPAPALIS